MYRDHEPVKRAVRFVTKQRKRRPGSSKDPQAHLDGRFNRLSPDYSVRPSPGEPPLVSDPPLSDPGATLEPMSPKQRYVGSGPYCYANSLAMVLGPHAPDPSAIEVLTGSPFGFEMLEGNTPLFDPLGWEPDTGLDDALARLGWTCERQDGGGPDEAVDRLREASAAAPVLAGPVEMGLLLHQPGSGRAIGADHFVVVTEVTADTVYFHDPHGHPHATLPIPAFTAAWQGDSIGYTDAPFVLRTAFRRERETGLEAAIRATLPDAAAWLAGRPGLAPPGSLGGAEAVERLADLVEQGLESWQRAHLTVFAIRVGARRLADAAYWLGLVGAEAAAETADYQARLVGALQYPMVAGDTTEASKILRELAPTYDLLRERLAGYIS
jgi:hypothetical protein